MPRIHPTASSLTRRNDHRLGIIRGSAYSRLCRIRHSGETRTPGSASGPQKRAGGDTGTALRADSTTLAPSCASPTATGCGSPRSPPTPPVGNCPTSNCATATAPAARTASAKDTGLQNLPLHGFDQNQIWCAIVQLAMELTTWMQMLALHGHAARRWEPKRLRLRLFTIAARIARHAHRTRLRLSAHSPWAELLTLALARLEPT